MGPAMFEGSISRADLFRTLCFFADVRKKRPALHSIRSAWLGAALCCILGDRRGAMHVVHIALLDCARELLFDQPPETEANRSGSILARRHVECRTLAEDELGIPPLDRSDSLSTAFIARHDQIQPRPPVSLAEATAFNIGLLRAILSATKAFEQMESSSGIEAAMRQIRLTGVGRYPRAIARALADHTESLSAGMESADLESLLGTPARHTVELEHLARQLDTRSRRSSGFSNRVATLAAKSLKAVSPNDARAHRIYRAGLLHSVGELALDTPHAKARLNNSCAFTREQLRLVPYWSQRLATHVPGIKEEADLASFAFERLDGTGYFRGTSAGRFGPAEQLLAISLAWCTHADSVTNSDANRARDAAAFLRVHAAAFDSHLVRAVIEAAGDEPLLATGGIAKGPLSPREIEVLRQIRLGKSSKAVARSLEISPGTVRTHIDRIFNKLGCRTRATALLQACSLGLL